MIGYKIKTAKNCILGRHSTVISVPAAHQFLLSLVLPTRKLKAKIENFVSVKEVQKFHAHDL